MNNRLAVHFDNRGMNWEADACAVNGTYLQEVNDLLSGESGDIWKEEYPELVAIIEEDRLCTPINNRVENNTYDSDTDRFLDASDDDVAAWDSSVANNINV